MLHLFAGFGFTYRGFYCACSGFVLFYEVINGTMTQPMQSQPIYTYVRCVRSWRLSWRRVFGFWRFAGGLSVAYAIVHMLPTGSPAQHGFPRTASLWSFPCCWRRLSGTSAFGISGCRRPVPHADWRRIGIGFNQCDDIDRRRWWMHSIPKLSYILLLIAPYCRSQYLAAVRSSLLRRCWARY